VSPSLNPNLKHDVVQQVSVVAQPHRPYPRTGTFD
jgi:hypothetical protein